MKKLTIEEPEIIEGQENPKFIVPEIIKTDNTKMIIFIVLVCVLVVTYLLTNNNEKD